MIIKFSQFLSLVFITTQLSANSLNDFHISESLSDSLSFSFVSSGHIYGAANQSTPYPAATILTNLDLFEGNLFFASLGDMYDVQNDNSINNLKKSFLNKINIPVFNAVGNHDIINVNGYKEAFNLNDTYFAFKYQNNLFIFLDTEKDNGKIIGDQRKFLENISNKSINTRTNIFVFTHRFFWKSDEKNYLFFRLKPSKITFNKENSITSMLKKIFINKKMFIYSGDLSQKQNLPAIYYKDDDNLIFIAIGNGDTVNDSLLQTNIDQNNNVTFDLVSLTGVKLKSLEEYSLDSNNFFMTDMQSKSFVEKVFYYTLYPYHYFVFIILFLLIRIRYINAK